MFRHRKAALQFLHLERCLRKHYLLSSRCASTFRTILSQLGLSAPLPPKPPKHPTLKKFGEQQWWDDYSWLDIPSKPVLKYLKQEHQYYNRVITAQQRALQSELLHGLKSFLDCEVSLEEPYGAFTFQVRPSPVATVQETILRTCMRTQQTVVVLSHEICAEDARILDARGIHVVPRALDAKFSRDGRYLAYLMARKSDPCHRSLVLRDLEAGCLVENMTVTSACAAEFAAPGAGLLYTEPDWQGRPCRVYHQDLADSSPDNSAPPAAPFLIVEESDPRAFITLASTKDGALLTLANNTKTTSQVMLLPAHSPRATPWCVSAREPGLEYHVEHHCGQLLLLTNAGSGNGDYRLMTVPAPDMSSPHSWEVREGGQGAGVGAGAWQDWRLLVSEPREGCIEHMDVFHGRCVLYCTDGRGWPRMHVLPLPTEPGCTASRHEMYEVPLPPWSTELHPGLNAHYHATRVRLTVSSPVHPPSTCDFDLDDRAMIHRGTQQVPASFLGSHDPDQYLVASVKAESSDGTKVPLTLALPRHTNTATGAAPSNDKASEMSQPASPGPSDRLLPPEVTELCRAVGCVSRPMLVEGYGAYGRRLSTEFDALRLSAMERGWGVAFAHVRGGGDLGRGWHQAAARRERLRALEDYLACVDLLCAAGLTSPGHLAGHAHSAGALLLAPALAVRPGVFGAAVLSRPFTDMRGVLTRQDLPLSEHEYDEWGGPEDPEVWRMIQLQSPINALISGPYPPVLASACLTDGAAPYWGVVKWLVKLRACQTAPHPATLRILASGSHLPSPAERAADMAFLITAIQNRRK